MPFTTEITNVKSEINAGLAAAQYTAKDLVYVSKAIEALANAETVQGTFDTATVETILYVGNLASAFGSGLTNPVAVFQTNEPDYAQIAFRNTNAGANASTDLILYTNDGTDDTGWIDIGMTSTNFADPDFTITGKGDGYIFVSGSGNDLNDRGNLVLATDSTGTQNKIIFAAGGLSSNDTQMVITPDVNVHIEIPTASTSPSTGALTVVGGVGIQGDVNIQGDITFGGTGTTLTTTTLSVSDAQVTVGSGNTTDALDLGIVGNYGVGGTAKYTGIIRDATDGVYKFFKDTTVAPTSGVVNFSGAGLAYATIKVGGAEIGSVTNTEIGYLSGVTGAIQTQLDTKAVYPTQTGNSGNFLTTNGTSASWAAVYPSQTGNSGKYLTTNGSTTSWATVDALPAQANNSGYYLTTNGTVASWQPIVTDPMPQIFMMMGA